jgi:hypothetical protein
MPSKKCKQKRIEAKEARQKIAPEDTVEEVIEEVVEETVAEDTIEEGTDNA